MSNNSEVYYVEIRFRSKTVGLDLARDRLLVFISTIFNIKGFVMTIVLSYVLLCRVVKHSERSFAYGIDWLCQRVLGKFIVIR